VNVAQARIRMLYEQVRALEAEAARPVRRRRLPRALLLVAAALIGAASAGVARHPARHEHVHAAAAAAAAVVHLVDRPAERARALPAAARRRVRAVHRHVAPRITRPRAPRPSAPAPAPVAVSQPVARAVHTSTPVRIGAHVHRWVAPHRVAEPVAPVREHATPQPVASAPVGIGPVAVSSADEPVPADAQPPTAP
jgi:hypothetical protein